MNTNLTTDQTLTQDALILELNNRKILQPSSCISGACCQVGPGSRVRYYAITATSMKSDPWKHYKYRVFGIRTDEECKGT